MSSGPAVGPAPTLALFDLGDLTLTVTFDQPVTVVGTPSLNAAVDNDLYTDLSAFGQFGPNDLIWTFDPAGESASSPDRILNFIQGNIKGAGGANTTPAQMNGFPIIVL